MFWIFTGYYWIALTRSGEIYQKLEILKHINEIILYSTTYYWNPFYLLFRSFKFENSYIFFTFYDNSYFYFILRLSIQQWLKYYQWYAYHRLTTAALTDAPIKLWNSYHFIWEDFKYIEHRIIDEKKINVLENPTSSKMKKKSDSNHYLSHLQKRNHHR